MSYFENDNYELDYLHHPKEVIQEFLEPCPFCGSHMVFNTRDPGRQYRDCVQEVFLSCTKCSFRAGFGAPTIRTDFFSSSDEQDKVEVYLSLAKQWNKIKKDKDFFYFSHAEELNKIAEYWELND